VAQIGKLSISFGDRLLARTGDPSTSVRSAARSSEFRARHAAIILQALRDHGPMTAHEIAAVTRLDNVQISRRGKQMVEDKLVTIGPDVRDGCRIWCAIP
jgi:transposase